MPRNGSGVYDPTVTGGNYPAVYDTIIDETKYNTQIEDIADALTASLAKDGQTTPTANLPMGGYKLTGLGAGSASTDSAHLGQVQAAAYQWCGTAGGTANALTLTPAPAISAYAAGEVFRFKAGASANSGAATVAISGLSTIAIQQNGAALTGGEIEANKWYEIVLSDASTAQLSKLGFDRVATQTEMEAASSNLAMATPGNINWHPGVAKAFVVASAIGTTGATRNITSITDIGVGELGVTIATDFNGYYYSINVSVEGSGVVQELIPVIANGTRAAGYVAFECRDTAGILSDPGLWFITMFGYQ